MSYTYPISHNNPQCLSTYAFCVCLSNLALARESNVPLAKLNCSDIPGINFSYFVNYVENLANFFRSILNFTRSTREFQKVEDFVVFMSLILIPISNTV